uniref:Uncharacterized protein n=1 Tax=Oryzias melastigma TaxID=30732 RepID=A0A3B3CFS2_ORYME
WDSSNNACLFFCYANVRWKNACRLIHVPLCSLGVKKDLLLSAIAVIKSFVLEPLSGVSLPRGSHDFHAEKNFKVGNRDLLVAKLSASLLL